MRFGKSTPRNIVGVRRHCDCRENADNGDGDHDFDQGEARCPTRNRCSEWICAFHASAFPVRFESYRPRIDAANIYQTGGQNIGLNGQILTAQSDFLVIGGGVIGLSSALAIRASGASVALIEAQRVGSGASWAGGGILSALLPWDYSEPVVQLVNRGAALYATFCQALSNASGVDCEYRRSGMIVLGAEHDRAYAWARDHDARCEPAHWLEDEALLLPEVAQVRNPRLIAALRGAANTQGIRIIEHCRAQRLVARQTQAISLETSTGQFHAGGFVVALGAWTPDLTGPAVQIEPEKGQMLLYAPRASLERIVYRHGVYLIPRADRHILVGSTREYCGFDTSTTASARESLMRAAGELFPPLANVEPIRHWAGLRPTRPDDTPVIDAMPPYKNVFINAGHGRYGLTMAPAAAEVLTARLGLRDEEAVSRFAYRWQGPN